MGVRRKDRLGPDRLTGVVRGGRIRQRRMPRLLKNKWMVTAIVVLVVLVAAAAGAVYLFLSTQLGIQSEGPNLTHNQAPKPEGEPELVLLVGSDSREGLTAKEKQELGANDVDGERADTLIL